MFGDWRGDLRITDEAVSGFLYRVTAMARQWSIEWESQLPATITLFPQYNQIVVCFLFRNRCDFRNRRDGKIDIFVNWRVMLMSLIDVRSCRDCASSSSHTSCCLRLRFPSALALLECLLPQTLASPASPTPYMPASASHLGAAAPAFQRLGTVAVAALALSVAAGLSVFQFVGRGRNQHN